MNQEIPDNYKDLKVKHEALMGDYLELSSRVERLEELLRSAHASRFSFKSEHLTHPGMLPLFPEEGEEEKDEPKEREVRGHTRTITKKPIPEHLPRVDVHLDVPDHEKPVQAAPKPCRNSRQTSQKSFISSQPNYWLNDSSALLTNVINVMS